MESLEHKEPEPAKVAAMVVALEVERPPILETTECYQQYFDAHYPRQGSETLLIPLLHGMPIVYPHEAV